MCLRLAGTMSAMSMSSHFQRPLPQREAARQPVQEGVPGDAPAKRQRTQSQSRTTAHLITLSPRTSRSMTRPCPTGRLMSLPHPCQRGVLGPVWKSHNRSFPPCPLSLVHHHSMSSMRPSSPHPRRLHRAMATHLCEPALAHLCPSCPCRRQPLCTLILRDQLMCSSLLPKNAPHSDRLTVAPTRCKYISPARHRRTRLSQVGRPSSRSKNCPRHPICRRYRLSHPWPLAMGNSPPTYLALYPYRAIPACRFPPLIPRALALRVRRRRYHPTRLKRTLRR